MFPVSIILSTIAIASGVGSAAFFSPLFILALGLPPEIAIGIGLISEVFGFGSGIFAYARKKIIDFKLAFSLIIVTVPMAVLGSFISGWVDSGILRIILGVLLFVVAINFLKSPSHKVIQHLNAAIKKDYPKPKAKTCLVSREKEEICYTVCNRTEGRIIAGLGGLFVGMVSTGLGELDEYFLLQRCRVPSKVSVATSVFVVACTALFAAIIHFSRFTQTGGETFSIVLNIIAFSIPGAIIGGQLGPIIAVKIPKRIMLISLGGIFIIIAVLTLIEAIL